MAILFHMPEAQPGYLCTMSVAQEDAQQPGRHATLIRESLSDHAAEHPWLCGSGEAVCF